VKAGEVELLIKSRLGAIGQKAFDEENHVVYQLGKSIINNSKEKAYKIFRNL
jgi:hypothetical protein